MEAILNIESEIDRLLANFPGNRSLQRRLGIIYPDDPPYESLQEIPWHSVEIPAIYLGLMRILIKLMRERDDRDQKSYTLFDRAINTFISHTNRLLLMELIARSDEAIIPGCDTETIKLYIGITRDGYKARLHEINSLLLTTGRHALIEEIKLTELLEQL